MKIRSRHEGQVEKAPHKPPLRSLSSGVIESAQAATGLSEADREFVIAKLVEMLVLDYQANQLVPQPTVQTPSVYNRGFGMASHRQP